jgi:hypothetical protein
MTGHKESDKGVVEMSSPLLPSLSFALLLVSPSSYPRSGARAALGVALGHGLSGGLKGEEGRKREEAPWGEEGSRVSGRKRK